MLLIVAATAALGLAIVTPASAAPASQFAVESGATISTATGTPIPESGKHAALWSNAGVATTTVSGSGRIVVGGMGQYCAGWPVIMVTVDGVVAGKVRLRSATTYKRFFIGSAHLAGAHQVRISMTNDHATGSCDRNAFVSYAYMETAIAPPPPPPPPPAIPGASNTGVPDGTVLTPFYGNMTITTPGTVINGLDIRGFVTVNASNVTIQNSIIRGGDAGTVNMSLIAAYGSHVNLVIKDTTLDPTYPSPYMDGLKGRNFTATRLDISNVVDTVLIFGDNVIVQDSWLHDNTHFEPDPRQSDNKSHDDNVQIEGGRNIQLLNNTMSGAYNAAVQVTQNYARALDITIRGNVLSDGGCTVNVSEKGQGPIMNMVVQDNKFGTSRVTNCAVIAPPTSQVSMVNNIWLATGGLVVKTTGA